MSKLRVGVIGAGHLGRIHAKLIQQVDGARLACVCDPSESARTGIADQHGAAAYERVHDAVDQIDAAIIASPTDCHAETAQMLLAEGKHVFVEKPLTIRPEDAQQIATLAKNKHLTLQVGHVERFNPAFTALGDLTKDVKYVEALRASSFPGRCLDVGVVMDLMIHDLDLILSMTSAPISSIQSSGLSVISGHEDIAETRIEFECGLVANVKASRISPTPARSMQIFGARGFAEIDFGAPSLSVVRPCDSVVDRSFDLTRETQTPLDYGPTLFNTRLKVDTLELQPRNAILDELHDFVISIQTGVAPVVDGFSGARAVQVASQILASIDQRRWYGDPQPREIGPHACVRESIEAASKRIHQQDRKAA